MENGIEGRPSRGAEPARMDVKSEVARTLIDAMERGDTPWQRPWSAHAMRPVSGVTGRPYLATNRLLLSLAGGNREDNRWFTYRGAAEKGGQVRAGEKGTMIVKLLELDNRTDGSAGRPAPIEQRADREGKERKAFALRRYFVFNAEQIDGIPRTEPTGPTFDPIERAEGIMEALREKTGLVVVHGRKAACYRPDIDQIELPSKKRFADQYAYFSCALHEAAHSTLAPHRMNRREALGKRWGDQAYAVEELRAEISSAILAAETGVPMCQDPKHIENHAAYLRSWVTAISDDPLAIFSAARDAEKMSEYLLGLERQMVAMEPHKEWLAEHNHAAIR
jgi:antirestriction protein ArdC